MFDNKYPYTDYHELNLDWFMGEFKKLVEEWATVQADWTSLHDYVQNYFNNLNVQTEIDNKINAMILNGTFADIVSPFVTAALPALVAGQLPDVVAAQISSVVAAQISAVVADQLPAVAAAAAAQEVGAWLEAHIDPDTGYVIDDSLTVSQAAADAKVTGDRMEISTGMSFVPLTSGYYDLSGATAGALQPPLYPGNFCCKISCNAGDKFVVNGSGASITRLWAFTDNSDNIIAVANANATLSMAIITAPENAAYFYSNTVPAEAASYFVATDNGVARLQVPLVNGIKEDVGFIADGSYLKVQKYIQTADGTEIASAVWLATDFINISGCDKLYVNTSDTYTAVDCGLAFYDISRNFIANSGVTCVTNFLWSSPDNESMSLIEVNVPANAVYIRASCRTSNAGDFYIKTANGQHIINNEPATPLLFNIKNPEQPAGTDIANQVIVNKCIDSEDISITVKATITGTAIVFLGSLDMMGDQHASHVQYDFDAQEIRIYKNGTGLTVPGTVIHTVDISDLGTLTNVNLKIGRKNRELWVAVEDYITGNSISYTVDEEIYGYKYPAGWLSDKLTYGIISGDASFDSIVCTTKAAPLVAFLGDSITEGYGVSFADSWPAKVAVNIPDCLMLGRSGATINITKMQINDIISKIKPKYVVVEIGTNGDNTALRVKAICDAIKSYGCVPILCHIPMKTNATTTANINATIIDQKEPTVGFDYATSVGNNLTTQDLSKYQADKVHPNSAGTSAMAARFINDVGSLIL